MNTTIFTIIFILATVVILIVYMKLYSRDIVNINDNFIHTKEFFKENPKLYEKFIDDCSKDFDIDEKIKVIKKDVEESIEKQINILKSKLFENLENSTKESMDNIREKIQIMVSETIKEESILKQTS